MVNEVWRMLRDKQGWEADFPSEMFFLCVQPWTDQLEDFCCSIAILKNDIYINLPHSFTFCKRFTKFLSILLIVTSKISLLAHHYRESHSYGCFKHLDSAPQPQTVLLSSSYIISYTVHQVMMTRPKQTWLFFNFTRNHSWSDCLTNTQSVWFWWESHYRTQYL